MILLTPREALHIQEEQSAHYEEKFPQLRERAEQANNIDGLELDKPLPAKDLVTRIPRGTSLGNLIGVAL